MKKIYRPTHLHAFLEEQGLHAKKRLSQNFLIDGNILKKIVHAADVQKGDFVLEIGPGPGSLTELLLEKGAEVLAIEMDPSFAKALERLDSSYLQVICADILTFPLESYLKEKKKPCKVIANLPYHITTPILSLFLPQASLITSLTLMVQKEFADRILAPIKTPDYSSLTLFFHCYATLGSSFKVSRNCFFPRPTVDSTVIHCLLHPFPLDEEMRAPFFALTRSAFGKKRKMLRASLQGLYNPQLVEETLQSLGLPETARPQELTLDQFIQLFVALYDKKE